MKKKILPDFQICIGMQLIYICIFSSLYIRKTMARVPRKNGLILFIMLRTEVNELHSNNVKLVLNKLYLG